MATLGELLRQERAKSKRLAKRASRVASLEAQLAEHRELARVATECASAQHAAMGRQDHVHADEVARLEAKLDRLLAQFEAVLARVSPVAPVKSPG